MFYIFQPALDLYSGNYNAFHYLYRSKNIKDARVSRMEFYIFGFSTLNLSFPFCTIPKTENWEIKTSDILIER